MTGLRLTLILMFSLFAGGIAGAQTLSYADAIKILSDACGADIERHCKKANLGSSEMRSCITNNGSATCKGAIDQVFVSLDRRAKAQADVADICNRDIARLCKGVRQGRARVLRCLLKAERAVGKNCNQAITDAGYR